MVDTISEAQLKFLDKVSIIKSRAAGEAERIPTLALPLQVVDEKPGSWALNTLTLR